MPPEWARSNVVMPVNVVALASAAEAVWAVAWQDANWWRRLSAKLKLNRPNVRNGLVSHVLCRQDGEWSSRFNVRGVLNSIAQWAMGQ
jgi:hypothetical protein